MNGWNVILNSAVVLNPRCCSARRTGRWSSWTVTGGCWLISCSMRPRASPAWRGITPASSWRTAARATRTRMITHLCMVTPSYALVTKKSMFTAQFRRNIDCGFMLGLLKCSRGKRFIIVHPPKHAFFFPVHSLKPVLTVCFTSGDISLMSNYDDLSPTLIRTGLKGCSFIYFICLFCLK